MAEVVLFRTQADLGAAANLRAFLTLCREQLTAFGADLPFDEHVWDVTDAIALKAKSGAIRAVFSTWATSDAASPTMMSEPFSSFAKAYFRYQHGTRPTKSFGTRLAALRALEHALTENGEEGDPCRIYDGTLDRAAQLAKDRFSPAVAYRVGGQLELVAKFLADHALNSIPMRWRNPLKRPNEDRQRVGEEFDHRRKLRLPSPRALEALASAFRMAEEPTDVIVCSIAAILCSAPERINEVLLLHANCEVSAQRDGKTFFGLRWWPSKGAEPQIKWLIPSMTDVVKQALSTIREHTSEAREIARWYEEHPGSLFLSRHLGHLRSAEWLSMAEVTEVLFAEPAARMAAREWCVRHRVAVVKRCGLLFARFESLENAVLRMLPRGFPFLNLERNLKYSDALCVVRRCTLHSRRATYRCLIEPMNHSDIHYRLGSRTDTGIRSVFDRLGLYEEDGRPIRISTHQFRHYLNTLAQSGGMSQLDIAKWSGRKEVRQNAAYDHVSDRSVLAALREAVGDVRRMNGPLATLPQVVPIPRDEFSRLAIPAVHTTEVGFCVHDFAMSPCRLHRDCFQCQELICVKGDEHKEAEIRRQCAETRSLVQSALQAAAQQCMGANRWVEHQQETLKRLEQLCAILDDPAVPSGSFIQLGSPKKPAVLASAVRDRTPSQQSRLNGGLS